MILDILKYPHPVLRKESRKIENISEEIKLLSQNMLETMYHAEGVGLAAPQVGQNIRLIVVDPGMKEEERFPKIYINPEFEALGEEVISIKEGCLSIPLNYRDNVKRFEKIRLKALDIDGNKIDEVLEGFPAIVVQHEIDHLNGVLFIDKISRLKKELYLSRVKKCQKLEKEK